MNKLFLVLTTLSIAALGCGSSTIGTGGDGGAAGAGGQGGGGPKCQTPQEMLRCDKVLNIAHGGGLLIRPAHTLLAYDTALEDGADMLELDIHETSDHVIVVMHDATVDRTTSCMGLIKEMPFAKLRECDAGYHFTQDGGETFPYRGMGLVVPSLEEVLDRYPDTAVNIEIKQREPSLVDGLVDLVRQYEFEDKMIGASFSDEVLAEFRAAAPEIATSLGEGESISFWLKSNAEIDPEYVPPGEFLQFPVEYDLGGGNIVEVLHPGFMQRVKEHDMYVHIWTVNDEAEMRELIEVHGVHGIMTDDPPLLTRVIEELGAGD
jgi:glycerophosphoryl diester phosphodiesterase